MPKSQKEINCNLLNAIYKNLQTAKQAINNVIDKIKDSKLKKELKKQFKNYDEFSESCEDLAKAVDVELSDNNFFIKAKMWLSVNMSTMMDKSNRKIASLNIVGTTMGIIDLMSVLSDCKRAKKELVTFGNRVLELEESNIENSIPEMMTAQFISPRLRDQLDDQAIHAIETMIMVEYARCNNLPGHSVVKAFNGKSFGDISEKDILIQNTLNELKK